MDGGGRGVVVGLEMRRAERVAQGAGVVLAQPDPDGPPLGELTWPGEYLVTAQPPAPPAAARPEAAGG